MFRSEQCLSEGALLINIVINTYQVMVHLI